MHHKENETKTQSCTTVLSSQITLVSPRLGAEKGVGRTTVFFFSVLPTTLFVRCLGGDTEYLCRSAY